HATGSGQRDALSRRDDAHGQPIRSSWFFLTIYFLAVFGYGRHKRSLNTNTLGGREKIPEKKGAEYER
ncbi:MAG: hypothetical protein AB1Z18_02970, partial [Desulfobacterales bacterium]